MTFPATVDTMPRAATRTEGDGATLRDKLQATTDPVAAVVEQLEKIVVGPSQINLKGYGALGDGSTNDSSAIAAALIAGPTGAVVRVPAGEYMMDPATLQLLAKRYLLGDGSDTSWFTLRSDTSGPAMLVDVTGSGVRGAYGTRIKGIGINLVNAPSAVGIQMGAIGGSGLHSAWTWLDDIRVEGGVTSLDCQSVNCKLTNFHFLNPSTSFIIVHPNGQEFTAYDGIWEVSPSHTVATAMDIPILVGGAAGAVYLRDIKLNNAGTVSQGIYEHCPNGSTASVPLRCTNLTLDNIAGPGYNLENVTDAQVMGGWVNAAAGTGNGAVRFYGGGGHTFMGLEQLNGGGGSACSFDFAGGTPTGIVLLGNHPATAVIYRLAGTGKPSNCLIWDVIANAAVQAQVTNDVEGLRAAMSQMWTPPFMAGREYLRENDTTPPAGYNTLVAGAKVISHAGIQASTRVKVWRERPGGTTGNLYCSVADNVAGTSFKVQSTSATDTSSFYWEMSDPI